MLAWPVSLIHFLGAPAIGDPHPPVSGDLSTRAGARLGERGDPLAERIAFIRKAAGQRFDDLELNIAITAMPIDDSGVPAAIANAIFHATGRRLRDLPITCEHLMVPFDEAIDDRAERRGD